MLTHLRLKNVKTWKDQLWDPGLELAPVTLLLGPNSAGKSSILQLPLLLEQSFASPDRHQDLNLGGQPTDLVDLGSYEAVIHGHDTSRELGIGFGMVRTAPGGERTHLRYSATFTNNRGAASLQELRLESEDRVFSATRQARGGYSLEGPGYTPTTNGGRLAARRTFQPERSISFSPEAIAELAGAGPEVQDLSLYLRQTIGNIAYLGPLRVRPDRSYLWSGVAPGFLGTRGEHAVHALLASENTRKRQKEGQEGGRQWLVTKVSKWLKRLGVADGLKLERHGTSRHYELIVSQGGQRANIMDVGFGVSQVLPMLVLAYFVPRGTTVIAEQPEIHLHPLAQAGLAELMAEVARERQVQFLVETHSEHLFRRLQTLVAEEKLPPETCALYFVEATKRGSSIRRLELDEFGKVSEWPRHFFGDAIGETERQTRLMIERLAAKRRGAGR